MIIRYSLRLGNRVYPHMKLTIDRAPTGERHFFRVDTHDQHVRPPAGSPEEKAFAELMANNQHSVQAIEAAWEASGIPTFKTFMRDDLARRHSGCIHPLRAMQNPVSLPRTKLEIFRSSRSPGLLPPASLRRAPRALPIQRWCLRHWRMANAQLTNVLFADDTLVMLECLERLGFAPHIDRAVQSVRIAGRGGAIPKASAQLFCGNSGTTIRFLTALCALGHDSVIPRRHLPNVPASDRRTGGSAPQPWVAH